MATNSQRDVNRLLQAPTAVASDTPTSNCDPQQRRQRPQLRLTSCTNTKSLLLLAALVLQLVSCWTLASTGQQPHLQRLVRQSAAGAEASEPPQPPPSSESPSSSTSTAAGVAPQQQQHQQPQAQKYPPLNFSLVDELFEQSLDEQQVAQKWRKMDKTISEGVRGLLKVVFPHIVSLASDAKVSGSCSGAILKWILNLRQMREWAVRMLDAIGKPSAGLLEGSLTMFGNYRQCLQVRAPDEDEIEDSDDGQFREYFRGQYCVLQLRPPLPQRRPFYNLNSTIEILQRKSFKYYEKDVYDSLAELAMAFNFVHIRADLCVPSLCSRDDIQRVADYLASKLEMRARVQRCDVSLAAGAPPQPQQRQQPAMWPGSQLDDTQLAWCLAFALLLLMVFGSSVAAAALQWRNRRSSTSSKQPSKSLWTAMCLQRSLAHVRRVHLDTISDTRPTVIYSLRLIVLVWICLVGLVSQLEFQFLREMLPLRALIMRWPMQLLVNSSLQFDALIVLTAFTYSYANINSNLNDLIKYNAAKYARLAPGIMFLVGVVSLTPPLYQDRSPVWKDLVDQPAQVCKSNGLINLTFLQNLLSSERICLPQTWLFCVELQLSVLAIPLVCALNRSFHAHRGRFRATSEPVLLLLALALAGCLANFANVWQNSLPAAWFLTFPDKHDRNAYMSQHLFKTQTHVSSFAVGLLAGHLGRCMSVEQLAWRGARNRRRIDQLVWLASGACMLALIFGPHSWSLSDRAHLEQPTRAALYAGLAPLLWSMCCAGLTLSLVLASSSAAGGRHTSGISSSCCPAGPLARLLAWDSGLVRLGRLSFLVYLLNPCVNQLVFAIQEQPLFSSHLMLAYTFLGNLVLSFVIALFISLLVELPCRRLITKLLIGARRQSTNFDIIARQLSINGAGACPPTGAAQAPQSPPLPLVSAPLDDALKTKQQLVMGDLSLQQQQQFQQQQHQQQQQLNQHQRLLAPAKISA